MLQRQGIGRQVAHEFQLKSVVPAQCLIHFLPNEILVIILLCSLSRRERRLGNSTLATLGLVCFRWRRIIIGEPRFWTYISLGVWKFVSRLSVDVLLLQIERCGTEVLLDLDFSQATRRWDLDKSLPMLPRPEGPRVRSFKWWGYNEILGRSFGHEVMDGIYQEMESLDVSFEAKTNRVIWYSLFRQLPGPKLRTAKIRGMHLKEWKGCQTRALTHLELQDCLFGSNAMRDLLQSCLTLETLILSGEVTDGLVGINRAVQHNPADFSVSAVRHNLGIRTGVGRDLVMLPHLKRLDIDGDDLIVLQMSWVFENLESLAIRGTLSPVTLRQVSADLCVPTKKANGASKLDMVLSRLKSRIVFQIIRGSFSIFDDGDATLCLRLSRGVSQDEIPHHILHAIEGSNRSVCLKLDAQGDVELFAEFHGIHSIELHPDMSPKMVLGIIRFLAREVLPGKSHCPYPTLKQLHLPRLSDTTSSSLRKALADLKKRGARKTTPTFYTPVVALTVYAENVEIPT